MSCRSEEHQAHRTCAASRHLSALIRVLINPHGRIIATGLGKALRLSLHKCLGLELQLVASITLTTIHYNALERIQRLLGACRNGLQLLDIILKDSEAILPACRVVAIIQFATAYESRRAMPSPCSGTNVIARSSAR